MSRLLRFAVTLSVTLASQGLIFGASHAAEPVISLTIDFNQPDNATAAAQALSARLDGDGKIVQLDLAVIPKANDGRPIYNINRVGVKAKGRKPVKCDSGYERFSPLTSRFEFEFGGFDNHLLLSVVHGDHGAASATVACEYSSTLSDDPIFVIRGRYITSQISVPTAVDIELRPAGPGP